MRVYEIRTPFPFHGLGLCNQLCHLVNALENAVQVLSLGNGVILKSNIETALFDGHPMTEFPAEGYHAIDGSMIGRPCELRPPHHKLEIAWSDKNHVNFMALRGNDHAHWLDGVPDEVHVNVFLFRKHFNDESLVPFSDVLDIDAMNILLQPLRIRINQLQDDAMDSRRGHGLDPMLGANYVRRSTMFRILISMIRFREEVVRDALYWNYRGQLQKTKRTSVVHLRNEKDAVEVWSRRNGKNPDEFRSLLNHCYFNTIRKWLPPLECDVIVLTSEFENNPVVQWMLDNGYHVHHVPKSEHTKPYREVCAAVDMEASRLYCDHTFIGTCNIKKLGGSTFSYFLFCMMPPSVTKVCIDIDNLLSKPEVFL